MKIGIYDPYLDDCGGGEKYMMSLAECLATEHSVSVFWNEKGDFDKVFQRFGLNPHNISLVPNIFSPHTGILKKLTETKKYDALIILSDGSIPSVFSKRLFIHLQQPLKHFQKSSIKDKIKLSRVTGFFCNSEYTKNFIIGKFNLPATVLYPPVALYPQESIRENVILHVGRFRVKDKLTGTDDYKKQHIMIKAFKDMVDDGWLKNWKSVLAVSVLDEDKDDFEKMRETAKGYPIEFEINQTNKELWKLYSSAKIYWHASGFGEDLKAHPEAAEHFGISTVEAMGGGCVPVVINAGGQKEIVTDGENGYLWSTIAELQEKTIALTEDTVLLEKLSLAAKKRAEFFAGDRFCREVKEMIR